MLKLDSVGKTYTSGGKAVAVLQGLSLHVNEGEFCAMTGRSGSGKSTLLNIMGLLDRPDDGSVTYGAHRVDNADERVQAEFRNKHIGFVFQSFNLLDRVSAVDNVGLPLLYRGVGKTERRRIAHGWLDRVGLSDRANHLPGALSGGQKQRVAIARALIGSPRIVLADEPTGNLDAKAADEVMKLLFELNRDDGVSVVVVTHDQGISAQCGRTIVIGSGVEANMGKAT